LPAEPPRQPSMLVSPAGTCEPAPCCATAQAAHTSRIGVAGKHAGTRGGGQRLAGRPQHQTRGVVADAEQIGSGRLGVGLGGFTQQPSQAFLDHVVLVGEKSFADANDLREEHPLSRAADQRDGRRTFGARGCAIWPNVRREPCGEARRRPAGRSDSTQRVVVSPTGYAIQPFVEQLEFTLAELDG